MDGEILGIDGLYDETVAGRTEEYAMTERDRFTDNMDDDEQVRTMRFLDALKSVLSTPDGLIVLRYWLDQSMAFGEVFTKEPEIYKAAALRDFADARMMEIAVASPKAHMMLLLQGHRDAAFLQKHSKSKDKE